MSEASNLGLGAHGLAWRLVSTNQPGQPLSSSGRSFDKHAGFENSPSGNLIAPSSPPIWMRHFILHRDAHQLGKRHLFLDALARHDSSGVRRATSVQ